MHRRHLITGIPAIWLAASAPAHAIARKPDVDEMVLQLVKALEELQGGEWSCRKTDNFVLFQKDA